MESVSGNTDIQEIGDVKKPKSLARKPRKRLQRKLPEPELEETQDKCKSCKRKFLEGFFGVYCFLKEVFKRVNKYYD